MPFVPRFQYTSALVRDLTDSLTIRQLLASIHGRERGLPDFQRDFVLDPDATRELICSMASTYPAGSLLEIRNRGNLLEPREFE